MIKHKAQDIRTEWTLDLFNGIVKEKMHSRGLEIK